MAFCSSSWIYTWFPVHFLSFNTGQWIFKVRETCVVFKLQVSAVLSIRYGGYLVAPGFTSQTVEVDGIKMAYLDRPGSAGTPNPPTVVFVHGFTAQKLGWIPLIRHLPTSWRIIAIDLPGHGESGVSDDWNCSVKEIGSLLHKVRERGGIHTCTCIMEIVSHLSCINMCDLHNPVLIA